METYLTLSILKITQGIQNLNIFVEFCRICFSSITHYFILYNVFLMPGHIFARGHLANNLRLRVYYVQRALNRQADYRSRDL